MTQHLLIGGMVAAGLDPTGEFLLTVSHSGRGVFATRTWQRVARDALLAYPEAGHAVGIGPIAGVKVQVKELDYQTGVLQFTTPDGATTFEYDSGTLTVTTNARGETSDGAE